MNTISIFNLAYTSQYTDSEDTKCFENPRPRLLKRKRHSPSIAAINLHITTSAVSKSGRDVFELMASESDSNESEIADFDSDSDSDTDDADKFSPDDHDCDINALASKDLVAEGIDT